MSTINVPGNQPTLTAALAAAAAGDLITLDAGDYYGPFTVPVANLRIYATPDTGAVRIHGAVNLAAGIDVAGPPVYLGVTFVGAVQTREDLRQAILDARVAVLGSPALGTTAAVHAAMDGAAHIGVTTGITNPDVPRNVTATAGGTATDIKAVSVTVVGTNIEGDVITEVLPAFTVDTAGTVVGSKAFKTITSISYPAHDGTGCTVSIGLGSKLGLPFRLSYNLILRALLNGAVEATAPTVAVNQSFIESNTVQLATALNGTPVVVVH